MFNHEISTGTAKNLGLMNVKQGVLAGRSCKSRKTLKNRPNSLNTVPVRYSLIRMVARFAK